MISFDMFSLFARDPDLTEMRALTSCCDELVEDASMRGDYSLHEPMGSVFFRSRIGFGEINTTMTDGIVDVFAKAYSADQMGAPPFKDATPGRFNKARKPVLYLSSTREIALSETRASPTQPVSVGKFITIRDLTLLDLTAPNDLSEQAILQHDDTSIGHFWERLAHFCQTQFSSHEAADAYRVTQLIASVIEHAGYDGIRFRSSFAEPSWLDSSDNQSPICNIALFDTNAAVCQESDLMRIERPKPLAKMY